MTMHDVRLYDKTLTILAPHKVPPGAGGKLLLAYSESWRTYHNSAHILQMLELARSLDVDLSQEAMERLELMILYHDAWYKVGRSAGENEKKSAEWAWDDLSQDERPEALTRRRAVKQGILATATHSLDNINPEYVDEIATLLDLDLWGLGQSTERFQEDTEKVWREYQSIATRQEFDAGRAAWARSFLAARKRIYHTEPFLHLEDQARRNLEALAG
jgi:predicted metal-dependent HD superfamily phosphohydrolase